MSKRRAHIEISAESLSQAGNEIDRSRPPGVRVGVCAATDIASAARPRGYHAHFQIDHGAQRCNNSARSDMLIKKHETPLSCVKAYPCPATITVRRESVYSCGSPARPALGRVEVHLRSIFPALLWDDGDGQRSLSRRECRSFHAQSADFSRAVSIGSRHRRNLGRRLHFRI